MRFLLILFMLIGFSAAGSDSTRLYNPAANATKDVQAAVAKAKKEKKHVLLQIGGNWCIMCYRFNAFVHTDTVLKRMMADNYVVYHLNYSKENKNLDYLKKLGNPQRFGFPVFVVLDANGNRLHTQAGGLMQKGNGYDTDKVKTFFTQWSPAAFDSALHKD